MIMHATSISYCHTLSCAFICIHMLSYTVMCYHILSYAITYYHMLSLSYAIDKLSHMPSYRQYHYHTAILYPIISLSYHNFILSFKNPIIQSSTHTSIHSYVHTSIITFTCIHGFIHPYVDSHIYCINHVCAPW